MSFKNQTVGYSVKAVGIKKATHGVGEGMGVVAASEGKSRIPPTTLNGARRRCWMLVFTASINGMWRQFFFLLWVLITRLYFDSYDMAS